MVDKFYHKPTDDEHAAALTLLELSRGGEIYWDHPTTNPGTVEAVECKNLAMAATTTTARMTASALGNVKKVVEPCSTFILSSSRWPQNQAPS